MNFDSALNKIIVFLLCFILCLCLFIGSFFVKVSFATDSSVFIPVLSADNNSILRSDGYFYGQYGSSGWSAYVGSLNYDDIMFGYYIVNGVIQFTALSSHSDASLIRSNSNTSKTGVSFTAADGYDDVYVGSVQNASSSVWIDYSSVPQYDSLEDFISVFLGTFSGSDPLFDGFNIPRGYLAAIQFNNVSLNVIDSVSFSTVFSNNSAFLGNVPFPTTSQWYNSYSSSSNPLISQVISNKGSYIPWVVSGKTNILGQSKFAVASLSVYGSNPILYVCNPVYQLPNNYQDLLNKLPNLNSNITISDPNGAISSIRLYSLSSSFDSASGSIDNSLSDDSPSYVVNGSTTGAFTYSEINSSTGAVQFPVENGGTYVDNSDLGSSDIIGTINNAFSNLISRLESIFHPAAGYFDSLVGSFSSFTSWLSHLWSWLPSPIVGLIEAVLYVSIVFGFIRFVL